MPQPDGPELFFGLVGAVGAQLTKVSDALKKCLAEVGYGTEVIRVIELLHQIDAYEKRLEENPEDQRYVTHMDCGDDFRKVTALGDALARLSIAAILDSRKRLKAQGDPPDAPLSRLAYVFQSIKHPQEIATLRKVYGSSFYVISAYTPREIRLDHLTLRIASSNYDSQTSRYRSYAEKLVDRDEFDADNEYGQRVRDCFPEADLFIEAREKDAIEESVRRFIELLFGNTFHTPNKSEYGMFHALATALRSAALGRQVGASIATEAGDIIAVGTNEVPKFGGGQYWSDDRVDKRDFRLGEDVSDVKKRELVAEVLKRLKGGGWLDETRRSKPLEALVGEALPILKGTGLMNLIEFGRVVHAEMAALLDAARRGVSVEGGTMYTTTFPCHDCTRHIIAAGLKKVIYIEPYSKSLASRFHLDSVAIDSADEVLDQVMFQPFVGVAPRLYTQAFKMDERKCKDGKVKEWVRHTAIPRLAVPCLGYLDSERAAIRTLDERMAAVGLKPVTN